MGPGGWCKEKGRGEVQSFQIEGQVANEKKIIKLDDRNKATLGLAEVGHVEQTDWGTEWPPGC